MIDTFKAVYMDYRGYKHCEDMCKGEEVRSLEREYRQAVEHIEVLQGMLDEQNRL